MAEGNSLWGAQGSEIGDIRVLPDRGCQYGPHPETGALWLRALKMGAASNFPRAARVDEIKCHGAALIQLPASIAITGYATDDVQTVVACFGSPTHVLVTVNGGAAWSLVAHNLGGGNATHVAYTGTRFVVVGNTASTLFCAYSTNGAAFTVGGSLAPGATLTANTARIAWGGTQCILVASYASGTAGAQAASTADGVALTACTLSQSVTQPVIVALPAAGAGRWLIFSGGATTAVQSTHANGTSWANRTLPGTAVAATATATQFVVGNAATLYRSATGADGSWTTAIILGSRTGGSYNGTLYVHAHIGLAYDGNRVLISGGSGGATTMGGTFGYTADLVTFSARQLAFPISGVSASPVPIPVGANLVFLPVGTAVAWASYSTDWYTQSEYVGLNSDLPINGSGGIGANSWGLHAMAPYVRVA